jgi:hypothetical protein
MLAEGLWSRERMRERHQRRRERKEHFGELVQMNVDGKNLYQRAATAGERLRGEEPITQFGRMCARLGIELIGAGSPHAKGRRGTDARDASGSAGEEAASKKHRQPRRGERLSGGGAFAGTQPAVCAAGNRPEDYHRRGPRAGELDKIFRVESLRTISDDWRVRYDNRFFQLLPQTHHYAKANDKGTTKKGAFR